MPRHTDPHDDDSSFDQRIPVEKDGRNDDYLLDSELSDDQISREMADYESVENLGDEPIRVPTNPFRMPHDGDLVEPQNAAPRRKFSGPSRVIKASELPTTDLPSQPPALPITEKQTVAPEHAAIQPVPIQPVPPPAVIPKPSPPKPSPAVTLPAISFSIPNGSEGKPFEARIRPTLPPSLGTSIRLETLNFQFIGIDKFGIEALLDDQQIFLRGTPIVSGEVQLQYQYALPRDPVQGRPEVTQTGQVAWFVNPDPRSLWKNLSPEASLPYQKSHTDRDRVVGPATVIAASVRGRSHAHEGTFRDDDFILRYDKATGWYLLTVCDGAGSAKFSRRGSQLACQTVGDEITPHFSGSLASNEFEAAVRDFYANPESDQRQVIRLKLYEAMGGTAMKAFKAIQAEVKQVGNCELNHFATTIIFTIAKNYNWGWFVGAFCIGDGGAAIYSKDGKVKVLNKPDGGEFAGQTRFLTMPDIWSSGQKVMDRIQFDVSDNLTAIVAMTDGVSDPKFETDNRFFDTQCWHDFWKDLEREVDLSKNNATADQQLLKWLDFWSPGNHDDRTLALLLP